MNLYQQSGFSTNFFKNSVLFKLLYANLGLFLVIQLLTLFARLMTFELIPLELAKNWLAVPANPAVLLYKPWTLFTYMFLHLDFWHIFFNMLWLYFMGQLFVQFLGEKKLWTVYIAGGLSGGLLYIIFYNIFPLFSASLPYSKALGASASVMAVIIAIATYMPNFSVRLLLFGNVKLKYIALVFILIDLFNITGSNAGGHIAHLGGAALGYFFAKKWKEGKDITLWVEKSWSFIRTLFGASSKRRGKMKVTYSNRGRRSDDQAGPTKEKQKQVDRILDKISKSGYDSLTKAEKDFLFKASQDK